ncbi:MAG: ATP-binding cassette domain-containing protein [Treponema sp.]|nr:ATP-binding cassette domain-containing protein [Treponema sp.]
MSRDGSAPRPALPPHDGSALRLGGVRRYFRVEGREVRAVDGVDLELAASGITTIVGPSGCGKTTLLRLAAGLDLPDSGEVWRRGGSRLGFVFQEPRLLRSLTVEGNILLGLGPGRADRSGLDRVREVEALLGLEDFARAYPDQLSGGLAQRAALGRALVRDPELLFMDEPFSALDARLRRRLQDELVSILKLRAISVVFVTHDLGEAVYLGDRVLVMREGRIVREESVGLGRPRDLRSPEVHALEDILAAALGAASDSEENEEEFP